MVLEVVAVCALRAVEEVHGLLLVGRGGGDLLGGRVRVRVGDLGGAPEGADADAVPEVEEEGRGRGEDDIAVWKGQRLTAGEGGWGGWSSAEGRGLLVWAEERNGVAVGTECVVEVEGQLGGFLPVLLGHGD